MPRKTHCSWPGCQQAPDEDGAYGMCQGHATARQADELAGAYLAFADRLVQMAETSRRMGLPESVPDDPPGPRELLRLARQCRQIVERKLSQLPDQRPRREVLSADAGLHGAAALDPYVEEGLLGLWAGRPFAARRTLTAAEWAQLRDALACLEPQERQAVVLVQGQAMRQREAAAEMAVSKGELYRLLESAGAKLEAYSRRLGHEMPI